MKRTIALFFACFVMFTATRAKATLDPAKANGDAAAIGAEHRAFCTHPAWPMQESALELCPLASDIPDCQPFADACDRALKTKPTSLPTWLTNALKWIATSIGKLFNLLGPVGMWILAGGVLGIILYPIVQSLAQSRPNAELGDAPLAPLRMKTDIELTTISRDDDPTRLLEEANDFARRGLFDGALYRYLHAALLALDKRGAIRIARETTHGEYVRFCEDAEARPPLRDLVREIDVVRFGGRKASQVGVEKAQERATWIVRRALGAAVTMLAIFFTACSPHVSAENDAAGSEMLRALLEKQNIQVKRSPSSLARIPLPTAANRASTPALYVDVERVPLETDAQEHLMKWVEAGGILVLAGSPKLWPKDLKVDPEPSTSREIEVTTYPANGEEDDDDAEPRIDHGKLAHPAALAWHHAPPSKHMRDETPTWVIATTADEKDYAAAQTRGDGSVYGVASDDLFTNAGLAIPGNAAAAIAILANVPSDNFIFASSGDGYSPPTNPFLGLLNAGLGLPLAHALFATIILFFAVGMRLAAPSPDAPPERRAFTEHIFATAAIYGRTRAGKHALAAFGRFAENRVGKRLGRGAPDIVSYLAQRSGEPIEACAHLWGRALAAREFENDAPNGDELKILQQLSSIYSRAMH